jgi:excisionase family DNA binding protein
MEKVYHTVQETAEILGISPRTIYNSICINSVRKFIKPRWFGNKPLFHKDDIEDFIAALPTENLSKSGRRAKAAEGATP